MLTLQFNKVIKIPCLGFTCTYRFRHRDLDLECDAKYHVLRYLETELGIFLDSFEYKDQDIADLMQCLCNDLETARGNNSPTNSLGENPSSLRETTISTGPHPSPGLSERDSLLHVTHERIHSRSNSAESTSLLQDPSVPSSPDYARPQSIQSTRPIEIHEMHNI